MQLGTWNQTGIEEQLILISDNILDLQASPGSKGYHFESALMAGHKKLLFWATYYPQAMG